MTRGKHDCLIHKGQQGSINLKDFLSKIGLFQSYRELTNSVSPKDTYLFNQFTLFIKIKTTAIFSCCGYKYMAKPLVPGWPL